MERLADAHTTVGVEPELMASSSSNDLIGVEEEYRLAERFGEGLGRRAAGIRL